MAVNTTEIGTVYSSLMTAILVKYDDMWASNEIDAETYATLVGQASSQVIQLASDLVQKQEALDKDNLVKDKQLEIAEQERIAKVYEVANILPAQLAAINKDVDVKERSMVEEETTGAAQRTILATEEEAKQYEVDNLLPEQLKVAYTDRILKDKQVAKLGLDNVMKLSEASRDSDANFVYLPKYITI